MFGGPCLSLIMKAVVKRISHVSSWGKCIHTLMGKKDWHVFVWCDLVISLCFTVFCCFVFLKDTSFAALDKKTHCSQQSWFYIFIYIQIYIYILNVLFSVKWQVVFYYTYSNEEEVYIHSQGPFRTKKNNTALRRLKQTGGGWGCCRSHVAAFGRWMEQHKTSSFSCLFFYRKLTNCQKEQKHLIMCHYKVS